MRVRIAVMALSGLALVAAGCSGDTTTTDVVKTTKDLKIKSINPSTVYLEGQDIVTITTENGCGKDKATLTVGDLPVTGIQATDLNTYTFTAPPKDVGTATQVVVTLACSGAPESSWTYGKNSAVTALTYDPNAEPAPTIKTYSPNSNDASVLSQMVVQFTRAVDPSTVTKTSFGITGITGTITPDADGKTFRFKPDQQLSYSNTYSCFVTTDIKSAKAKKGLRATVAPTGGTVDPNKDAWSFQTRCEGCGNPWLGDISAAAGISSGGQYKLFSVTGQPTPVGEATNDQYKIQSGFIYATTPSTGGN